jgi:DNA-binding IclR family transcriptional regulator
VSFFYLRSGLDFVVAERVEQCSHPGMLNDVGYRRPLIMSAGGVAMLCVLPRERREAIADCNLRELADMGIPRLDRFSHMLERSLQLGYGANLEDVAAGINSFSVPILDRAGLPIGSIAIAGDPARFPAPSGRKFADLLSFEATELGGKSPGLSTGRAHAAMVEAVTTAAATAVA